jgi:hypothetical protein
MMPLGRWGRGGGEIIFMVGAKKGFVILARCGTERLNGRDELRKAFLYLIRKEIRKDYLQHNF